MKKFLLALIIVLGGCTGCGAGTTENTTSFGEINIDATTVAVETTKEQQAGGELSEVKNAEDFRTNFNKLDNMIDTYGEPTITEEGSFKKYKYEGTSTEAEVFEKDGEIFKVTTAIMPGFYEDKEEAILAQVRAALPNVNTSEIDAKRLLEDRYTIEMVLDGNHVVFERDYGSVFTTVFYN